MPSGRSGRSGFARAVRPQWLVVAAAVLWNYWWLRSETLPVATLDDSSVHEQMVRFAAARLRAGHLPQTSWFPFLGLGSPQFLHYQSLPSTVTGAVGIVVGPDRAFSWSLYLLLSLWPVSVYWGARAMRWGRWTSALAAAASPFLVSAVGVGFEAKAYVWIGFGVWTQLWAMWTLPLAWGFCWQAVSEGRRYGAAVACASLTVMLHFETGYLAVIPLVLVPWVSPSAWRPRVVRALVVLGGTLAATAWVTVPVLVSARWASVNEVLRGTPLENGYGARRVLSWLATGGLLDAGRLPVVTVLAGAGLVACIVRFRRDERGRVLVVLLAMSLLLSSGRTTFGALVDALPGSTDLFLRRFMMGVQLASLLLAGVGASAVGTLLVAGFRRSRGSGRLRQGGRRGARVAGAVAVCALAVAAAVSVLAQSRAYDSGNATAIHDQVVDDALDGPLIAPLLDRVRAAGNGRVYAGLPDNWGAGFLVGQVPVVKYLEDQDVDEVGYTLRTASLMTDPEYHFDQSNPGDYTMFGVRYLLLPTGMAPPVPARPVMHRGPYSLWELPGVGYVSVARSVGTVAEDRADVGEVSVPLLRSELPDEGRTLLVDWDGDGRATGTGRDVPAPATDGGRPGSVVAQRALLDAGSAAATVRMVGHGLVVLSASFDPGWTVTVDGRPAAPVMVAPALVAVQVGPGTHRIVFRYRGYAGYPYLMALSVLVLAGAFVAERWWVARSVPRGTPTDYPPDAPAVAVPAPTEPPADAPPAPPADAPPAPPDPPADPPGEDAPVAAPAPPAVAPDPELPVPVDPEVPPADPPADAAPESPVLVEPAEAPEPLDPVTAPPP